MTADEIGKIVNEIVSEVTKKGILEKKNPMPMSRIKLLSKYSKDDLLYFDKLLKHNKLEIFVGNTKKKSIADCQSNDIVIFKSKMEVKNKKELKARKVKISFAGTIHIAENESNIRLYSHQEAAFSNMQKEIIKADKNPFAGLLVLPTGGGKTLTAAHWLSKKYT